MEIIKYEEKYLEDVRDLLVELEEYIVSIDEDQLDTLGKDYREKMALYDLKEVDDNDGLCLLAKEDDKIVGLIMGIMRKYEENDYLDYKCPTSGIITELVIKKDLRSNGVGSLLINEMEKFFKEKGCEYSLVDVFAYNKMGINFYDKHGYHPRMYDNIKKL